MEASLTITPKIQSVAGALDFGKDLIRNPPTNPIQAIKTFSSAFGLGGALTLGITAAFPFAAAFLPAISGILDLFGGGGPSIGEMTFQELGKIENQIREEAASVKAHVDDVVSAATTRTINMVLSGVDEVARIQSAANVFKNFAASQALTDSELKKATLLQSYTDDLNNARKSFVDDTKKMLTDAQAVTDVKWNMAVSQVQAIAGSLMDPIMSKMQAAQNELLEIQEIQKQIDEIKATDPLVISRMIVRRHYRLPL